MERREATANRYREERVKHLLWAIRLVLRQYSQDLSPDEVAKVLNQDLGSIKDVYWKGQRFEFVEDKRIIAGEYVLSPERHSLNTPGGRIELTPTRTKILAVLMSSPDVAVTYNQIAKAMYGQQVKIDQALKLNIKVNINYLREDLRNVQIKPVGEHARDSIIETVRGCGYRFSTKVTREVSRARE